MQTKIFVQSQKNFARLHNRETVTFRNSDWNAILIGPGLLDLNKI